MNQETQPDPKQAKRVKKNEFAGVSSVVQLAGVAAFIGGGYIGYREATNIFGQFDESKSRVFFGFLIAGAVVGLILLIVGGSMASKYVCGNCRNVLSSKEAKICPACGYALH